MFCLGLAAYNQLTTFLRNSINLNGLKYHKINLADQAEAKISLKSHGLFGYLVLKIFMT